jgi:outer membrane biosynthesis protein TonB
MWEGNIKFDPINDDWFFSFLFSGLVLFVILSSAIWHVIFEAPFGTAWAEVFKMITAAMSPPPKTVQKVSEEKPMTEEEKPEEKSEEKTEEKTEGKTAVKTEKTEEKAGDDEKAGKAEETPAKKKLDRNMFKKITVSVRKITEEKKDTKGEATDEDKKTTTEGEEATSKGKDATKGKAEAIYR